MLKIKGSAGLKSSLSSISTASPVSCPCSSTMPAVTSTPAAFASRGLFDSSRLRHIFMTVLARAVIRATSDLMTTGSLEARILNSPCTGALIVTGMIVFTTTFPAITACGESAFIPRASREVIYTVPFNLVWPLNKMEPLPPPAKTWLPPSPSLILSNIKFSTPRPMARLMMVPFFRAALLPLTVKLTTVLPHRSTVTSSPSTCTLA